MSLTFNPFTGTFDFYKKSTTAGTGLWVKVTGTVTASSTLVLDTVALSSFTTIKYLISAKNTTNTASKYLELMVNYDQNSLKDSVSGKINQGIRMDVDANLVATNLELSITNNESFDIDLDIAKIILT